MKFIILWLALGVQAASNPANYGSTKSVNTEMLLVSLGYQMKTEEPIPADSNSQERFLHIETCVNDYLIFTTTRLCFQFLPLNFWPFGY